MTPEEITKLAVEYAEEVTKDMAKTLDEPSCLLNETKRATKEYITDFMQWLLRTHCIVEKRKVRDAYYNATPVGTHDRFGTGYNLGVIETLKSLFSPDTFNETDK